MSPSIEWVGGINGDERKIEKESLFKATRNKKAEVFFLPRLL